MNGTARTKGFFHGARGDCRNPEDVEHVYLLADVARGLGVLTVGIGDGGNEVGFGAVRDAIAAVHPLGARSHAGHASCLVTVTATDVVVSASISNWGAYAIAAALASHVRNANLLHSQSCDRRLIEATVLAGARDGASCKAALAVDGIDLGGHSALRGKLHNIVRISV
ncbi:DUF4392 domain-containing protein [Paraburkholderia dipogonis]|uniref:DUF4392 domain-containing protein n=1 Tax=Paraburkholderia dipogonis TaxID=1211383 RepID=A0A4Y8MRN5_9BURK|nr:DUF4392 domain-containing protein [Paraburkholderia dipogonis]